MFFEYNMKYKKPFQKGGLKLKDASKKGFQPIYDMIQKPGSSLMLYKYHSLKGFMVILTVPKEGSEYLAFSGTRFQEPVTSYILKIVVTSDINDTRLPIFLTNIEKASESVASFTEEAKLQQYIWKSSIIGGRPAICPSIANLSLFDHTNSKYLLDFLLNQGPKIIKKGTNPIDANDAFLYLYNTISKNPSYGMGILSMSTVEQSETLEDFLNLPIGSDFYGIPMTEEMKKQAYANVLAEIIRLFIMIGVIHFDLHVQNSLIFLSQDNEIKCKIIDFGRASDINKGRDDGYLTMLEKQPIKLEQKKWYDILFSSDELTNIEKLQYIDDVMKYLAHWDSEKNHALFPQLPPNEFVMNWYAKMPTQYKNAVYVNAYNILKTESSTQGTNAAATTIKKYETEGHLINFDNISDFIVPSPWIPPPSSPPPPPPITAAPIQPKKILNPFFKPKPPPPPSTGGRKTKKYKKKTTKKYKKKTTKKYKKKTTKKRNSKY